MESGKVAHCVITGAAAGIGQALAGQFAAASYAITGIDLDADQARVTQSGLEQGGAAVSFIIANLAVETELERVLETLAAGPAIDVLIHNAGINAVGRFAGLELAAQQAVTRVNLAAPLRLTAGLLQQKRLRPGGTLVFISSLSHFVSYPGAAVYAASKDGLASYARSLRVGLAGQNINVLTVYPGPTRTAHARRYSPDNRREERRMPPEQLAAAVLRAVQKRQRILVPGFGNKLFATLGHFFPGLTEWAMRRMILDKLDPPPA